LQASVSVSLSYSSKDVRELMELWGLLGCI